MTETSLLSTEGATLIAAGIAAVAAIVGGWYSIRSKKAIELMVHNRVRAAKSTDQLYEAALSLDILSAKCRHIGWLEGVSIEEIETSAAMPSLE
jgi:hypothetical protein